MTMWTVQEFSNATNSWAVRVVKLIAPPPATPAVANPASIAAGQPSVNVTVTGTQAAGSGFYDPGSNLGGGAVPFSHIGASVSGGVTVNSVTFTSPTQITLNVSTVGATSGAQSVTVTNPDGQTRTGNGILTVSASAGGPTISSVSPNALGQGGTRTLAVNGTNFQSGATTSVSGTGVTVRLHHLRQQHQVDHQGEGNGHRTDRGPQRDGDHGRAALPRARDASPSTRLRRRRPPHRTREREAPPFPWTSSARTSRPGP